MSSLGTALIVEDDALVAVAAALMLEDFGYSVVEARTRCEAQAVLARTMDIALLFTDIELADGSSGVDLAYEVAVTRPDISIVVTSGRIHCPRLPRGAQFLPKPYSEAHLAIAVGSISHLPPTSLKGQTAVLGRVEADTGVNDHSTSVH